MGTCNTWLIYNTLSTHLFIELAKLNKFEEKIPIAKSCIEFTP
jgi:hypothetical protein